MKTWLEYETHWNILKKLFRRARSNQILGNSARPGRNRLISTEESCSRNIPIILFGNSAKPEVDLEPNRGEIGNFLPNKALLAETNNGPFLFSLGPTSIYASEINFSTCAIDSQFRSTFIGIHSQYAFNIKLTSEEAIKFYIILHWHQEIILIGTYFCAPFFFSGFSWVRVKSMKFITR